MRSFRICGSDVVASKPGKKAAKTKKTKPNGLFLLKALFALSVISAVSLVAYVAMFANRQGDAIPVSGEIVDKAVSPEKSADMEKTLNVDTIYENIFIEDIDVSRLTKKQAVDLLTGKFNNSDNNEIIFSYNGEKYTEKFSSFGAGYKIEKAVDEAYDYGRDGTLSERYSKVSALNKKKPLKIKLEYGYDEAKLEEVAEDYFLKFYVAPKEPGFSRVDGKFVTTPEVSGTAIDKDKLINDSKSVLESKKSGTITLDNYEVRPKYTEKEFAKSTSLLGSYTTNFAAGSTNRNQNIITAAGKINNCVIMPEEVFSTNKAFGETTYENGYRIASTYLGGKIVDGMGGGMCQVSTTLYMSLLYAETPTITERTNHSMKVGYVDYAYDATLAGDYIDLKFRNDTGYPVTIESVLTSKSITVNIYGFETRSSSRKLKFENSMVSSTQPAPESVTNDPTLPLNKRMVDVEQKIGYKYELYKLVYENDKLVERVRVNTSTYRVVQGQVRIGTGPPEATPDPASDTAQPEQTPEPVVQTPQDVVDPYPDPFADPVTGSTDSDGPLMP